MKVTIKESVSALIPVIVGADDEGVDVVTLLEAEEPVESPTEFVATTVNV